MRVAITCAAGFIAATPLLAQEGSLYLFDVVNRPVYKAAYARMVRGARLPPWMSSPEQLRQATATPVSVISVDGSTREIFGACKQHECGTNQLVVMFSSQGAKAEAVFTTPDGRTHFLGDPDIQDAKALIAQME